MQDWTTRAASSHGASGSVTLARLPRSATIKTIPKKGRLSTQFACARARRCMNGDRLRLSGLSSLAATAFLMMYPPRSASIKIKSASVQATSPRITAADAVTAWSSIGIQGNMNHSAPPLGLDSRRRGGMTGGNCGCSTDRLLLVERQRRRDDSSGADVLIGVEDISWVVFVLEFGQPGIILAIGRLNAILPFFAEVVGVDAAGGERLHCAPKSARPSNIDCVVGRIIPDHDGKAVIESVSIEIGGRRIGHAANRAAHMLEHDERSSRSRSIGFKKHIDSRVGQFAQKLRLPVVASATREDAVIGGLNLQVRPRYNAIFDDAP